MQKPAETAPVPTWLQAELDRIAGLESAVDQHGALLRLPPRLKAANFPVPLKKLETEVRKARVRLEAAREMEARSRAPAAVRGLEADATHAQLARALLARLGDEVIWDEASFWVLNRETSLWKPRSGEAAEAEAAEAFEDGYFSHARRDTDYRGITRTATKLARRERFFAEAPHGLVIGRRFLRVDDRKIVEEVLESGHRQRWALDVQLRSGPPTWLLAHLTRHAGTEGQIERTQEAIGATLFGIMNDYKRVVLLKGEGDTGKSTLLHLIERLLPPGSVAHVGPDKLGDERFVVGLAGMLCNIAGDLDPHRLVSDAAMKRITGGDIISAKAIYEAPVSFRSRAAQWFAANDMLAARDRSEAFYSRWLVIALENSLPAEEQNPNFLEEMLAQEDAQIVAWAIEGARRLVARGHFKEIPSDEAVLREWRSLNDSVQSFLLDPDGPVRISGLGEHRISGPTLYKVYREATMGNGGQPMGLHRFYAEIRRPMWLKLGVQLRHGAEVNTEVLGLRATKLGLSNLTVEAPRPRKRMRPLTGELTPAALSRLRDEDDDEPLNPEVP